MPEPVEVSVVLPSYLEEENLRLLLPRLKAVMDGSRRTWEIVVVDTVQRLDATPEVCAQHGVRYLNRSPTNSFGDAVRTGIAAASGRWVIFMDADGSHAPEFIPQLLEHAESSDVVIASRYVQGGHTENTWALKQMSRVLNFSYSVILGLKLKDVSNSFKLYRADLLKEPALRCQNFDIIEEVLFKISRAHPDARIKEVPFTFKKRMFGETKRSLLLFILTYLFTMLKLRFDWGAGDKAGREPRAAKRWPHVTLSLVVFLANMIGAGYRAIWQDEAETAERARTILESGWPRVIDASGAVSVNTGGDEIEEGVTHRYTPWGQFYLGAFGLALGEVTPMDRDTSLRMPFIAAHAASSGLLSYGLAAFTGAPLPLALGAGAALALQTVRTVHGRTARYHGVLDMLAVLGAFALGGLRKGRRWALPVWGATLFLAPHFHTMGGSVAAAALGLWGLYVIWREAPGLGGLAARARAAALYGLLPGAISLALLVWLVRPSAHAHWGVMNPIELGRLWPSRSLSDPAGIAYVAWFVALSVAGLLALRRWWAAGALALSAVAIALAVGALDFHPFSQFRYYLFIPVLAFAWPVALGLGREPRRWVPGVAAGAIAVAALIPDVWLANVSTPPPFPPFQGMRLLWSDARHRFAGDRQPLHQAVALIQQRSAPGDPVVFDYVPQFVNWYLPGHPVALMPDWTAKNPLNEHNPIWDKPVQMPKWHVWYTNYINGTWKCSGRCDYGIGELNPAQGSYVLRSRKLGQSARMCIAGAWPTHQWNNAPFIDYSPEALAPSGPRTVVLVVGTPCPPDGAATPGQGH